MIFLNQGGDTVTGTATLTGHFHFKICDVRKPPSDQLWIRHCIGCSSICITSTCFPGVYLRLLEHWKNEEILEEVKKVVPTDRHEKEWFGHVK